MARKPRDVTPVKQRHKPSAPAHAEQPSQPKILAISEEFSGPIPPPAILQQYEQIAPGSAQQIIAMAASEASFRHEISHRAIRYEARDTLLGQVFALIIGMTTIICGTYTAVSGHPIIGGLLGASGLGGLVTAFIMGRRK